MPKMKTHSGAKKRFRITGKGKVKRFQANKRHILTKKNTKRKRRLTGSCLVDASNENQVKRLLPNG